ncbi:hypothetical protein GN244_ATG20193 [Phytophthora infestans]|uniref:Uncharacterized protein n=1 Tax=Phytophthora infestans TaxID=4787 RepID=A0A833S2T1_PHYIN|nr:hypothetical protein GN244_ATG20193 [Phytophthora infestans]
MMITVELNFGTATDVGGVSTAIPTEVGDVVDIEKTLPAGEMETQRTNGHETSVVRSTIQFGLDTEDVGEDTAIAGDIESDIGNEQQSVESHTHECIEDYDLDEKVKEILEQDQMGVENTALPIAKVGKRSHRDETDSELLRVEQRAEKPGPKKTRTGLREYSKRRRSRYLDEYIVNVAQRTERILDKNGKAIHASSVPIPRNNREMNRSKYREFWMQADMEEMSALRAKGVIMEIPERKAY